MTVSYESLVHKTKETLQAMEDELDLKFPTNAWETIFDGNQKYYDKSALDSSKKEKK